MSDPGITSAERLDQYVTRHLPELSRAYASKLIEAGKVNVNELPTRKSGYKLRAYDTVTIDFDASNLADIPDITLDIIYEDDDCVVINKPIGLLSHSKGAFNPEATVATWLARHLSTADTRKPQSDFMGQRVGIVHRLDRATSGVMICAKNPAALTWLQKQFAQRKTKKAYTAIVSGHLNHPQAIIDMPLERNPKRPQTFRVGANGKPSVTNYLVSRESDAYSQLELTPTTGRTHQLRVHLSHLGHPIVGDTLYGGQPAERLFLHAGSLELTLTDRQRKIFVVPLPPIFDALMSK